MTIRKANIDDAETILKLINLHAEQGQVLFRTLEDIRKNIGDCFVCEKEGEILGTCSLKYGWDKMVEIRSLAVAPEHYRQGMATELVRECIEKAGQTDSEYIFVLTYAVPLFEKLGFEAVDKAALPLKIWSDCAGCRKRDNCDEIALVRPLAQLAASDTGGQPLNNSGKAMHSYASLITALIRA
ncbi:MAG: N-acetyltransferase [Nitrospinae bacterium]|nr:N-acetyltransferase [Nitrospinota bacterium]